ncbi:MAG: hypothetical protein IPK79_13020 [Vampirovibrionales bacterium]|nr:hypothetical protein [Vampirovibrionales bacterium]
MEIDRKPSHAAAGEFIINLSTRLKVEVEGKEQGIVIEDPIVSENHQILNGQLSELLQEYSMVNLLLIADECHQLV